MEKQKKTSRISLKPSPKFFRTLVIALGVVMVWRGIWNLLDTYFLPHNELLSNIICVLVGVFLLYLPNRNLDSLV